VVLYQDAHSRSKTEDGAFICSRSRLLVVLYPDAYRRQLWEYGDDWTCGTEAGHPEATLTYEPEARSRITAAGLEYHAPSFD
jgi:hypothetical protein